jgi:hypothetical protein
MLEETDEAPESFLTIPELYDFVFLWSAAQMNRVPSGPMEKLLSVVRDGFGEEISVLGKLASHYGKRFSLDKFFAARGRKPGQPLNQPSPNRMYTYWAACAYVKT